MQDEGEDVFPPLKDDERGTWCALVLPGAGILWAGEIEEWSNSAVFGPQVEDSSSSGLSHPNPLRLGQAIGDRTERRCIGGFDAGYACIDATLSVQFERQLIDEWDQHISRRGCNCRIRRSTRLRPGIENIRPGATVDRIDRIVDGDVHHRVD